MKKYVAMISMIYCAACTKSKQDIIPPSPQTPVVDFTYNVEADHYPIKITFNNTSVGYSNYTWRLGAITSNAISPISYYDTSGKSYSITLIGKKGTLIDSATMDIIIPCLDRSVRIFYIIPADKFFVQAQYDAVVTNADSVRQWYLNQLGKKYKLNNPIAEVVYSTVPSGNFLSSPGTVADPASYFLLNSLAVLKNLGYRDPAKDSNYIYNVFVQVHTNTGYGISDNGTRAAGIPEDGLTLLTSSVATDKRSALGWWAHELGHSFGLAHPSPPDSTNIMTNINGYPAVSLSPQQKLIVLNNGFMF